MPRGLRGLAGEVARHPAQPDPRAAALLAAMDRWCEAARIDPGETLWNAAHDIAEQALVEALNGMHTSFVRQVVAFTLERAGADALERIAEIARQEHESALEFEAEERAIRQLAAVLGCSEDEAERIIERHRKGAAA